eukprot:jgi/Bigna1/131775/aug1.15_g6483
MGDSPCDTQQFLVAGQKGISCCLFELDLLLTMQDLLHFREQRQRQEKTLVCFVKALVGSRVDFELRGGAIVRGVLESVDAMMNCKLIKVRWKKKGQTAKYAEYSHIPGRQIVYIHIPDEIDVSKKLDSFVIS